MKRRTTKISQSHDQHLEECGVCVERTIIHARLVALWHSIIEIYGDSPFLIDSNFFFDLSETDECAHCFMTRMLERLDELQNETKRWVRK